MTGADGETRRKCFIDWRLGLDVRTLTEAGLHIRLVTEAIDAILAEHGLSIPLTVCRNCRHYNENTGRCESEEQCRINRA